MDIIIIGGGASAVLCAIEASKNKNNNITIIEANNKLMKKLLVSGNGKCNFTNLNFLDKNIITKNDVLKFYNNDFYFDAFKEFSNIDLINYFYSLGLAISIFDKYDKKYVYPLTKNSRTLYYLLMDNLNKNNIKVLTEEIVISFTKDNNRFNIITNKNKYNSDVLVISSGGKSYYDKVNVDNIYNSLKSNNINTTDLSPALIPLEFEKNVFDKNSKFRFEANISLMIDGEIISNEFGEIQINDKFISGIPVLNISSKAIIALKNKKDTKLVINFLYNFLYNRYKVLSLDISFEQFMYKEVLNYFNYHKTNNQDLSLKQLLSYLLDTQLIEIILNKLQLNNIKLFKLTDNDIDRLINELLYFKLNIIAYQDFKNAQVTHGGVDIDEIDSKNFESNKIDNLFFTGEVIDVDGICGGYNLQFAFGTGYIVGKNLNDKN